MVTQDEAYEIGAAKLTELGFTPLDSVTWTHPDGRVGRLGIRPADCNNPNSPVGGVLLQTAVPTLSVTEIVTF